MVVDRERIKALFFRALRHLSGAGKIAGGQVQAEFDLAHRCSLMALVSGLRLTQPGGEFKDRQAEKGGCRIAGLVSRPLTASL